MPATPADIGAASRVAVVAEWSNATILARYPSARDGRASPRDGLCDSLTDAQALADAEGSLLGVERRRFVVSIDGLIMLDPSTATPTVRIVDAELAVDLLALCTRIELDLETERTSLELLG